MDKNWTSPRMSSQEKTAASWAEQLTAASSLWELAALAGRQWMVTSGVVVTWESVCIIRQSEYIFRLNSASSLICVNFRTSIWEQFPFPITLVVLLLGESPGRVVVFEIDLINVMSQLIASAIVCNINCLFSFAYLYPCVSLSQNANV